MPLPRLLDQERVNGRLLGMGSAMSQTTPRPDLLDDVPTRARIDRTLALRRQGYRFVDRRRR